MDHYKNLGVTHFIFILNNNTDNSEDIIIDFCRKNSLDVEIYTTNERYSESKFGLQWVHEVLNNRCKSLWCTVVDIDEFILPNKNKSLRDIQDEMIKEKSNVLQTVLIDFYPDDITQNYDHQDELNPFKQSPYYDVVRDDNNYFKTILTDKDNCTVVKGGLRHRWLNREFPADNSSTCLTKKSFFKYDFYDSCFLDVGMHWIIPKTELMFDYSWDNLDWEAHKQNIKYHDNLFAVAHFKFIKPDIIKYFKLRVTRNEDWNDSCEYKQYISNSNYKLYNTNFSAKFKSVDELYNNTIEVLYELPCRS